MTIELRDYQLEALARAEPRRTFGLFLQQRMGKTITALHIAQRWGCKEVLVVCPRAALRVWPAELKKLENSSINLTVTTFGKCHYPELQRSWDCLIVDESHRIKSRDSLQTKRVWALSKLAKYSILLSGTPMGNGYEDYYAQLKILEPSAYPTWSAFSEEFCIFELRMVPGRTNNRGEPLEYSAIVGYRNLEKLKALLDTCSIRRLRSDVTTSIRKNSYVKLSLDAESTKVYNQLKKDGFYKFGDDLVTTQSKLIKVLKLHQVCGGSIKLDSGEVQYLPSPKIQWIANYLSVTRHPVVVVCKYVAEMEMVEQVAASMGKTSSRVAGKTTFDGTPTDVVVLQPQSGVAIDLSFCKEMVIYSTDYSFLNWDQFLDRTVTMNSTSAKYIYLVIRKSVDELVLKCLKEKQSLESQLNHQEYLQDL